MALPETTDWRPIIRFLEGMAQQKVRFREDGVWKHRHTLANTLSRIDLVELWSELGRFDRTGEMPLPMWSRPRSGEAAEQEIDA